MWWVPVYLLLHAGVVQAQKRVQGSLLDHLSGKGVAYGQVYWLHTNSDATADSLGNFVLPAPEGSPKLVVRSVGYHADTVDVVDVNALVIVRLRPKQELVEVTVEETISTTTTDYLNARHTQLISVKELQKAACCNLSESFETSPSVDVSFSDALTGTRQIQMLGLSGQYSLITEENLPGPSGILGAQGLALIPGSWIQSIQLVKGAGSVANGYESLSGQINVELWKADTLTKPLLNMYANAMKRLEINGIYQKKISSRLTGALLVHGNQMQHSPDRNGDGFRDLLGGSQINTLVRFRYFLPRDWIAQIGGQWIEDERVGGQNTFHGNENGYAGFAVKTRLRNRSFFGKLGKVFPGARYHSIGILWSLGETGNQTRLGFNRYKANETNAYLMAVYQGIIKTTDHQYKIGVGLTHGKSNEELDQTMYDKSFRYYRLEWIPGFFGEYTGQWSTRLNAVAGLRLDYHNLFGLMATPRFHLRFEATPDLTLRASAGLGRKLTSLVANNLGYLASNREWHVSPTGSQAYGFLPDVGWNSGASAVQTFRINRKRGSFTTDYYCTWFQNQVITDLETAGSLRIYALNGKSYAHSFSAQWDQFVTRKVEIKLAYRAVDNRNTFTTGLLQKPLIARHRAFANAAWVAPHQWKADATLQWTGSKRLPASVEGFVATQSPSFFTVNAQISKAFHFGLELYAGVENLTDYRQKELILFARDVYNPLLDGGLVWGPVIGRMVYGGLRWSW